jgi:hypothetical protein
MIPVPIATPFIHSDAMQRSCTRGHLTGIYAEKVSGIRRSVVGALGKRNKWHCLSAFGRELKYQLGIQPNLIIVAIDHGEDAAVSELAAKEILPRLRICLGRARRAVEVDRRSWPQRK